MLKLHPRGNYFQNSSKKTKHEIEIMKNSTEILLFRNIKTVKHMNVKASWWVVFMDQIQNISSHSPFISKPTQEIHKNRVPKYDFDKS